MLAIPGITDYFKKSKNFGLEDRWDRLNLNSAFLFAFVGVLLTGRQTFGQSINCFAPAESLWSWSNYYNSYCFIENKVLLEEGSSHKSFYQNSKEYKVLYYQWIPYILIFQACLFSIPYACWEFMTDSVYYGKDIESVMNDVRLSLKRFDENRVEVIKKVANQIDKELASGIKELSSGCSVSICYVIKKWVAHIIVAAQFVFIALVIPHNFDLLWGFRAIAYSWSSLRNDSDTTKGLFPKVIRCDIEQLEPNNNRRSITMPCLLMLNYIYEKIFIGIYFYLLIIFFVNLYSAIDYTVLLLSRTSRKAKAKYIFPPYHELFKSTTGVVNDTSITVTKAYYDHFIYEYLSSDGLFIFLFVFYNFGGVLTHDLCKELWSIFIKNSARGWQEMTRIGAQKDEKTSLRHHSLSKSPLWHPTAPPCDFVTQLDELESCDEEDCNDDNNNNNNL